VLYNCEITSKGCCVVDSYLCWDQSLSLSWTQMKGPAKSDL